MLSPHDISSYWLSNTGSKEVSGIIDLFSLHSKKGRLSFVGNACPFTSFLSGAWNPQVCLGTEWVGPKKNENEKHSESLTHNSSGRSHQPGILCREMMGWFGGNMKWQRKKGERLRGFPYYLSPYLTDLLPSALLSVLNLESWGTDFLTHFIYIIKIKVVGKVHILASWAIRHEHRC